MTKLEKIIYVLRNRNSHMTKSNDKYELVCEVYLLKCKNCKMRIPMNESSYDLKCDIIDDISEEEYNYIQNNYPELFI